MKYTFPAQMRRALRLARAGKPARSTRALQRAIGGAMLRTASASLATLGAIAPAKAKAAAKPRKAAAKTPRKRATAAKVTADRKPGTAAGQVRAPRAAAVAEAAAPAPLPRGGRFLDRTHNWSAGTRDFRLFLPAGPPRGLIVMLHGCGQDPDDFATGTGMNAVAARHGLAVAYPAQTRVHNRASCWNWFAPAHQKRGGGEPAALASLTRALMAEFALQRGAVFVAGLSAGGAMAVILLDTYPDVFAAAGVHSGLARGAARDVLTAHAAMRGTGRPAALRKARKTAGPAGRRIVFHGDADTTVHPLNAPRILRAAVGARVPARVSPARAGGRAYLRSDYALPDGSVDAELWVVKGAGHAWSGGQPGGSFSDTAGPDASAEMVRFFLQEPG